MKSIFYPLIMAVLLGACQTKEKPNEETQATVAVDSTQYFADLHSDEVLKAMIKDDAPHPQKVIVSSFVIDSMSAWTDGKNAFYNTVDVFPFDSLNKKAVVVFANYWGEKQADHYKIEDNQNSGPTLFYGVYGYKENKGWYLLKKSNASFSEEYGNYGYNGMIGNIGLIQSGKERYALVFANTNYGEGYEVSGVSYYDITLGRSVFELSETTSNRETVAEDEAFEFSFSTQFIPSDKDYFDLEISYEGTHYAPVKNEDYDAPSEIVPFKQKVIYRFDTIRGMYVQLK